MNNKSIRWKQRFLNLNKAFNQLKQAVQIVEKLSDLEKEGLVQRFEYTFELSWKTLKDYLESEEVEAKFPREVIKSAFKYELISKGDEWMEMLEKRNMMAHTYDEKIFNDAIKLIVSQYYPLLEQLIISLKSKQ